MMHQCTNIVVIITANYSIPIIVVDNLYSSQPIYNKQYSFEQYVKQNVNLQHSILRLHCVQKGVIRPITRAQRVTRCVCCGAGLVPEPALQGETHEAAERAGRPETRLLPEPAAHEDPGGPPGARRAHPQRTLLLLRR